MDRNRIIVDVKVNPNGVIAVAFLVNRAFCVRRCLKGVLSVREIVNNDILTGERRGILVSPPGTDPLVLTIELGIPTGV